MSFLRRCIAVAAAVAAAFTIGSGVGMAAWAAPVSPAAREFCVRSAVHAAQHLIDTRDEPGSSRVRRVSGILKHLKTKLSACSSELFRDGTASLPMAWVSRRLCSASSCVTAHS